MNPNTSSAPRNRRARVMTAIFALVILIPSRLGFVSKFIEFIAVFRGQGDGSFAVTPMVNYLLATTGFFCLFGWALLHGMFREIEAPKQRMLETEEWLDRQEAASDSM